MDLLRTLAQALGKGADVGSSSNVAAATKVVGAEETHDAEELRRHLRTFIQITYRRGFPPLAPYRFTSDEGWGCMIRAAQMMVCNTLRVHLLGPGWRIKNLGVDVRSEEYISICKWFMDVPGFPHFYSIHHVLTCAARYDSFPGEWVGGHTISLVLQDLTRLHRRKYKGPLQAFVAENHVLYIDACEAAMSQANETQEVNSKPRPRRREERSREEKFDPLLNPPPSYEGFRESPWSSALLLLIPLRLGLDNISAEGGAREALFSVFDDPHCMGFFGGQRNRAAYFVGTVRDANSFLGLDPHRVEDMSPSNTSSSSVFPTDSFLASQHSGVVSVVDASRLDPCVTLGFYFRNRGTFLDWCSKQQQQQKTSRAEDFTLFSVETFTAFVQEAGSPTSDVSDDEGFVIV
jgi:cysteine protease ATG4